MVCIQPLLLRIDVSHFIASESDLPNRYHVHTKLHLYWNHRSVRKARRDGGIQDWKRPHKNSWSEKTTRPREEPSYTRSFSPFPVVFPAVRHFQTCTFNPPPRQMCPQCVGKKECFKLQRDLSTYENLYQSCIFWGGGGQGVRPLRKMGASGVWRLTRGLPTLPQSATGSL